MKNIIVIPKEDIVVTDKNGSCVTFKSGEFIHVIDFNHLSDILNAATTLNITVSVYEYKFTVSNE